jgi:hypothetical protein
LLQKKLQARGVVVHHEAPIRAIPLTNPNDAAAVSPLSDKDIFRAFYPLSNFHVRTPHGILRLCVHPFLKGNRAKEDHVDEDVVGEDGVVRRVFPKVLKVGFVRGVTIFHRGFRVPELGYDWNKHFFDTSSTRVSADENVTIMLKELVRLGVQMVKKED